MAEDLGSTLLLSEEQLAAERAKASAEGEKQRTAKPGGSGKAARKPGFFVGYADWAEAIERGAKHRDTRAVAWELARRGGGRYGSKELHFTRHDAARIGIPRDARTAALRELESLGLIELRRKHGAPFAIVLRRTK
jgi:hypothetical protein